MAGGVTDLGDHRDDPALIGSPLGLCAIPTRPAYCQTLPDRYLPTWLLKKIVIHERGRRMPRRRKG